MLEWRRYTSLCQLDKRVIGKAIKDLDPEKAYPELMVHRFLEHLGYFHPPPSAL